MLRQMTMLLPPIRWFRAAVEFANGIRIHPTATLFGKRRQTRLAKGVKIGARTKLDPGQRGQIIMNTGVWLSSDVEIETDAIVELGRGTSIQRRSTINGNVRLGRGCILAPSVFISSGTHPFREIPFVPIREQERRLDVAGKMEGLDRAVWIQDDCWIGTHAVICPGVTIGKGSIIGANSVVTKNVPPFSVHAGSPANAIGARLAWEPPSTIDPSREEDHPYLLDAHLEDVSEGHALFVSITAPLLAALAAPDLPFTIAVQWASSQPFVWVLNNRKITQEAGSGRIIIGAEDIVVRDNVVYCAISVEKLGLTEPIVQISEMSVHQQAAPEE